MQHISYVDLQLQTYLPDVITNIVLNYYKGNLSSAILLELYLLKKPLKIGIFEILMSKNEIYLLSNNIHVFTTNNTKYFFEYIKMKLTDWHFNDVNALLSKKLRKFQKKLKQENFKFLQKQKRSSCINIQKTVCLFNCPH